MLPAIEVRGVSKAYGRLQALSQIDLEVAEGECFGVLGPFIKLKHPVSCLSPM